MKRFTALLLTACLLCGALLSGCGQPSSNKTVITITFGADASGDASSDASADAGETITVSYGVANFYAQMMQTYYDYMFYYYYGDDFWETVTDESSDATLASDYVQSFMESLAEIAILDYYAGEYGVELSEEDEELIADAAAEFMEENAGKVVKAYGTNKESVAEYLRMFTLAYRVQEAIYAECEVDIDEEDAYSRTFSYILIYGDDDDDEDESGDASGDADEEEEPTAEELVELAREGDFEEVMETYDHNVYTHSYVSGDEDDSLDIEILNAADELSEGEISDPIEVDDVTYIVRLDSEYDEEATLEKIEELTEEQQSDYFDEVYELMEASCTITYNTKLMARISFATAYTYITEDDESGDADEDESADASADASGDDEE